MANPYLIGSQGYDRARVSDATAFDAGEKFTSAAEVREYFTPEAMEDMGLRPVHEGDLVNMAEAVIVNRWHCDF